MTASPTESASPPTILIVDGGQPLLAAASALLGRAGYRVHGVRGGGEALRALAAGPVDLVLCGLELPDGDGAALLQQVTARWPEVARVLLIGDATAGARESAIVRAEPSCWLQLPWQDGELRVAVKQGLQRRFLELERRRLTLRLEQLGHELEARAGRTDTRVAAATEELRQTVGFLEATQQALHKSYAAMVKMCSDLVGLRDPGMASYSRVIAEQAHALALRFGMDAHAARDVTFAALLHHIGKLGLPDRLLNKPFELLTSAEHVEMNRYPAIGAALLTGLEPLQAAAAYIRAQNECFDGRGQPEGLAREQIPLGARILSVVKGYHAVQRGAFDGRRHSVAEAVEFLRKNRGRRYDPAIVDAYLEVLDGFRRHLVEEPVLCVGCEELRPGMVLARDVVTDSGASLLTKDHVLDAEVIGRIRKVEQTTGERLTVFVWGRTPAAGTAPPWPGRVPPRA